MLSLVLKRGIFGGLIGIAIANLISIIISFVLNDGSYYPLAIGVAEKFGSEINGVLAQFILSFVFGFVYRSAYCVFASEKLSIVKQYAIHMVLLSVSMISIGTILNWIPPYASGIVIFFVIFFVIYGIIAFISIRIYKKIVKNINEKMCE